MTESADCRPTAFGELTVSIKPTRRMLSNNPRELSQKYNPRLIAFLH